MAWDIIHWGQFYTIFLIGFALGMDAFSLGIGLGMLGVRLKTIAKVSMVIGFFHILMPLAGIVAGIFLSSFVGHIASFVGGLILCFLGANMLWGSFFNKHEDHSDRSFNQTKGIGLLLFALSVSLDALSVGFTFGLFEVDISLALIIFGLLGMFMSAAGLLLGRFVGDRLGGFGEALGGVIILGFGIKFML
ncbi:MAG TPA: manganese efflux pump MntP family protein [Bacillota bacterium]|nr:manganese efflux pump MntP family protein [Bacillota bacterium]